MNQVNDLLQRAARHFQAGRLAEAEADCRCVLDGAPQEGMAWHLLGVIRIRQRLFDTAVDCLRRTVELRPTDIEAHQNLGCLYLQLCRPADALSHFIRQAELLPNSAEAQFNLANVQRMIGRLNEALLSYKRAIQLSPKFVEAYSNLGVLLQEMGEVEAAIDCQRRALLFRPNDVNALNNLGNAFRAAGKRDEGVTACQKAVQLAPGFAEAHYNLGLALQELDQLDEAAANYRQALESQKGHLNSLVNLGNVFRAQCRPGDAITCYREALNIAPELAEAWNGLGVSLLDLDDAADAAECFRRAIALRPQLSDAHANLGGALLHQGEMRQAIDCYQRAVSLNPRDARIHSNLGLTFFNAGHLGDAQRAFDHALAIDPSSAHAHYSQSVLFLLTGDFQNGWREHEWRWRCREWLRDSKELPTDYLEEPLWDGTPLNGKTILLRCEQGFGDTFQFVRYGDVAKAMGGRVVVECQPPLVQLLQNTTGVDQVLARGDCYPQFDCHAPLLSLPAILRTTIDSIPQRVPYITPTPSLRKEWREALARVNAFRIGINWHGRPGRGTYRRRNIPLEYFVKLSRLPGVQLVSLQRGEEAGAILRDANIAELGAQIDTTNGAFMDTAAIMVNLDLIISCDTSIPHLAGALGVGVWVALPDPPDWRWLLDRSDSPWYPTMRLFRQKQPGDWAGVFVEIEAALRELVAERRLRPEA